MDAEPARYTDQRKKLSIPRLVLIGLLHLFAIYALARAFAPGFVAPVEREVLSTFSVTVTTPEEPPEEAEPEPDEGAAGEAGKQAVPKPVTAEKPKIQVKKDKPMPRASSTGAANTSGARDEGDGTGAAGDGLGTGSGRGGGGQGGGIATKPSVQSGELNQSRDFPIPPGGRETRFGKEVIVHFTVTTDGRARDCRIAKNEVDAESAALVCPLVMEKIRFNPARRADGTPVEALYGYRVQFKLRN